MDRTYLMHGRRVASSGEAGGPFGCKLCTHNQWFSQSILCVSFICLSQDYDFMIYWMAKVKLKPYLFTWNLSAPACACPHADRCYAQAGKILFIFACPPLEDYPVRIFFKGLKYHSLTYFIWQTRKKSKNVFFCHSGESRARSEALALSSIFR